MLRRHPGVGAPTALCDHYDASWFLEQVCPGETAFCLSHHWYSDVWPYKRRANGTSAGATSHNFCRNAAREMQSYALGPSSETTVARASLSRVARSRFDSASTPARVRSANWYGLVAWCAGWSGSAHRLYRRKQATYPELATGGAQELCVLGCEVGGRWNADAVKLVQRLVALRAHRAPSAVREPAKAAWARRWWSLLPVAVQQTVERLDAPRPSPDRHMPMRRPWMRSYTWPTQMGRAACRCAEPARTRDRAFGRSGTLLLTEKV